MTFEYKVQARIAAIVRNYRRPAIGLVVDEQFYHEVLRYDPLFISLYYQKEERNGDTYLGLEVSVSKHLDTFRVY